jgi:hypothetical protein
MARRLPSPTPADLALLDPDGSFRRRLADDRERLAAAPPPAELEVVVHRLAGAAATFGYAEVGALAIALDEVFVQRGRPASGALPELIAALDRALAKSA